MTNPHIKLIRQYDRLYSFYDVNRNAIVEIDKEDYKTLFTVMQKECSLNDCALTPRLQELLALGYLSTNRPSKIEQHLTPFVEDYLEKRVSNLVLQVTQNCNLRCSYCAYSQNDYIDRGHNSSKMTILTAKKALRFLQEHSCDCQGIRISFYGGEPLLNFDVIKASIDFANEIMPYKNIVYFITTNLTVLDNSMIKDFIKNNVKLVVSLDGPKSINDKYRRFSQNGFGSFDKTYSNLKRIYDLSAEYFNNNVSINAVVDPRSPVDKTQSFFMREKIFSEIKVEYHILDDTRLSTAVKRTWQFDRNYSENILSEFIYYAYNGAKSFDKKLFFSDIDDYIDISQVLAIPEEQDFVSIHHGGPCLPGHKKLFVSTGGEFYVCEKANEKAKTLNIGSLESGFDYEKIKALYNLGRLTSAECQDCWAIRFCAICAMMIDDGNNLSRDLKLRQCKLQRKKVEGTLKNLIILNKITACLRGE